MSLRRPFRKTVALKLTSRPTGKPEDAGLALLTANVSETPADPVPSLPEKLRSITPLGTAEVTRRFVFTEKMEMGSGAMSMGSHDMDMGSGGMAMGAGGMKMEFLINGVAFDMNRVDVVSKVGDVELWEVVNQSDMDHPFHVHGTSFQVLSHNGRAVDFSTTGWKDTVLVDGRAELLMRFDHRAGEHAPYMFHCHILEHEDAGMMGQFTVV